VVTEWNPVTIAAEIRKSADRLENSAKVVADAREAHLEAKRAYTISKAAKRQESMPGSFNDRDDKATIATEDLWLAMDTADVAHTYARDLAAAMEKKISALQTEAKLIMQAYGTAGVGER